MSPGGGADHGDFPAIYIDGASGGDGSLATPYSDFASINWTTGGDNSVYDAVAANKDVTINLKRGVTWREQMTVGTSGSAAHPITIQAYGEGADPIISGADLVTGWTEASLPLDVGETGGTREWNTNAGTTYITMGNACDYTGIINSIELYPDNTVSAEDMKVGVFYNTTGTNYICRNVVTVSVTGDAGTKVTLTAPGDFTAFGVTAGDFLGIYGAAEGIKRSSDENYTNIRYVFPGADNTDGSEYTFSSTMASHAAALYATGIFTSATVWQATLTTEPLQVFFDGERGAVQASVVACTSEFDWFWESNVLYVYSASDPDAAYTSPGIEADIRDCCVRINSKDYVTIDGLNLQSGSFANVHMNGADNIIVQNCTCSRGYQNGIQFYGASSNITIDSNTINWSGGSGIGTSTSTGIIVTNNTVHNNCQLDIHANHEYTAGIKIYGSSGDTVQTDVLVANNTVYYEGKDSGGVDVISGYRARGIHFDEVGTGDVTRIIRYNKVYDCFSHGILIENESFYIQAYYNLIYSNDGDGIRLFDTIKNSKVYNNVSYDNVGTGLSVGGNGGNSEMEGNSVKNNISIGNDVRQLSCVSGGENDGTKGSGNVYTYNCLGAESSNFIEWGTTTYKSTYDDWETAYGGTTSSVEVDPLMADPGSDDFTLRVGSPCINRGTFVGLILDYLGLPVPIGHRPDIGAYEHKNGGAVIH